MHFKLLQLLIWPSLINFFQSFIRSLVFLFTESCFHRSWDKDPKNSVSGLDRARLEPTTFCKALLICGLSIRGGWMVGGVVKPIRVFGQPRSYLKRINADKRFRESYDKCSVETIGKIKAGTIEPSFAFREFFILVLQELSVREFPKRKRHESARPSPLVTNFSVFRELFQLCLKHVPLR